MTDWGTDMARYLVLMTCLVLPFLGGCAAFEQGDVPPAPHISGANTQAQAWRDEIQRDPQGDTPTFGPLEDARDAVSAAKAQPGVNDHDGQSLAQAEQALSEAEQKWHAIADQNERSNQALAGVAGDAHRAQRLAQISQYTAMRESGLDQLNQLQSQQSQMVQSTGGASVSGSDQQLVNQRVVPTMLGSLQFQEGTARLTSASRPVIGKLANLMKQHPKLGVAIFGFTDNATPPPEQLDAFINANPQLSKQNPSQSQKAMAYRQGLSDARARDIAQLLVQAGVDPDRIGARGLRDQHPIASNDTADGRAKNERAEAIMVPMSALSGGSGGN
ncbi:OmpA family protein [Salinisphaera sp. Q1T1-3]|uniref:OmpA family protein n=1 Tax=Salinisphaera sp. Q1T1-3 TaxID=2321229 RepID=UPI000E765DB9|nr:OmpA family protein [Salinisphaera sp. Q1T1-3]RJS93995.1 OmpA family protein [Salinisphaera sp. Q1T1-3]